MPSEAYRLDRDGCYEELARRLGEPAPSRIQLLTGPRQVGKTTLLLKVAEELGPAAMYAAADGPEALIPGFWERLWTGAENLSREHGKAVVLLDEAHLLPNWAARLKGEWDRLCRRRVAVHIVATGSSSLRITSGSRESLSGRFERLTLTHWSAASLAGEFGLTPDAAAAALVSTGSYPGAFALRHEPARWRAYVRDAIIEPAIGRDILALGSVRRPALLRQVFGICATSPAQIVALQKIQGLLQDAGALETISHYLSLLEDAYLVAPLDRHAARPARRRAAPPKLITLNNALLSAMDPHGAPDPGRDPARFGAWVENACLAHAYNAGQRVGYWREEPLEVDAVLDGSWGRWAVEVKTGSFSAADLRGLAEFTRRFQAYRPLVVCEPSVAGTATRLGFAALDWRKFLMSAPPCMPERIA